MVFYLCSIVMTLPQIAVVFNWRNEINSSGLYSIHLRITINRTSKYYKIDVPQKIADHQWTGKEDNWVKSHPYAFEINNKIREKKNMANDLVKRSYSFNKGLTFEMIFRHLKKKGNANSFYDFMKDFIDDPPEKLGDNTLKKYKTCLLHLRSYRKELVFSDIDNTLIQEFNKYMQVNLNLQGTSRKKYMDAFKRVIKCARKDNYLDSSQMEFLFDDVRIKVRPAQRTFLDIDEIVRWRNLKFPIGREYMERDRDLFLFQIYTAFYYKDFFVFNKDHLLHDNEHGTYIVGAREKNGNQTIIPLFKFPLAMEIIEKYKAPKNDKTVFAVNSFVEEPVYNRKLKELAKLADITKNVSNKVARHTNAQLWIRYGATRPVVSKMLGHTKEETTRNYYAVNLPEIFEGTKSVDFLTLGI